MRRALTPRATVAVALALVTASGCGDGEAKKPAKKPRSSAVAKCAGYECRVRVICKGRLYVRIGPAPVKVHTSTTPFRTTIVSDFAGSRNDSVIRC